jgi:hypothetical protein
MAKSRGRRVRKVRKVRKVHRVRKVRAARRVPAPAPRLSEALWARLSELGAARLKFGKRLRSGGRYYQEVRDERGRFIGRIPWQKGLPRRVKARLRLDAGERRARDLATIGLAPPPGWKVESVHPYQTGEASVWTRTIMSSRAGIPVGQPGENSKYLRVAFSRHRPESWAALVEKIPAKFMKLRPMFGVRGVFKDAGGREHYLGTGPQWFAFQVLHRVQGPYLLREMYRVLLSQAGRKYGYEGLTRLLRLELELVITPSRETLSLEPVRPWLAPEEGEDEGQ